MKIVFFCASAYVIPILEKLNDNFEIPLVVTTEDSTSHAVPAFCHANNIPYLSIENFDKETIKKIKSAGAEIAVLGYFGLLVPPDVLNAFPKGIINTHPSLLPKYRGPTPVQSAILAGEKETGMTIIKLDSQLDHGPILAQKVIEIKESDTTDSLHRKLFILGADMMDSVLNSLRKGIEQDHSKASYTEHLTRESGYIKTDNPPSAEKLDRMIRAYFPWPTTWTRYKLNDHEVIIKLLPEQKIQVEGKKEVNYKDFINGYEKASEFLKKIGLN